MCAQRVNNSIPFLEKVLSGIEKVLTIFSIPDKIFLKTNFLMYALEIYSQIFLSFDTSKNFQFLKCKFLHSCTQSNTQQCGSQSLVSVFLYKEIIRST